MNIKLSNKFLDLQEFNYQLFLKLGLVSLVDLCLYLFCLQLDQQNIYALLFISSCLISIYCLKSWEQKLSAWRKYFVALDWLLFPTVALIYLNRLNLTRIFPNFILCCLSIYIVSYLGSVCILLLEREICFYLFFGALTTIVSVGSFSIGTSIFSILAYKSWLWPQTISFILSLLFAFLVNRRYVFCSCGPLLAEFKRFVGSRIIASLFCEYLLMALLANVLRLNLDLAKIITAFMVVIINYILSKVFVFKKVE